MTLGELITHIKSGAKALFEWLGDFVGNFFEVFFHQVSWMESDVMTVALVVFSYLYLLIRIGDSESIKYLMDSEFRARQREKRKQWEMEEARERTKSQEREKLRKKEDEKSRAENAKLWSGE